MHSRNIEGVQNCRQTDTVHRNDTVHCSRNQNITCHAHFVTWQVINRYTASYVFAQTIHVVECIESNFGVRGGTPGPRRSSCILLPAISLTGFEAPSGRNRLLSYSEPIAYTTATARVVRWVIGLLESKGMLVHAAAANNPLPNTGSAFRCANWQLYRNAAVAAGSYSTKWPWTSNSSTTT